jgi:benzoyl-CoA-dihydrodiol lyase
VAAIKGACAGGGYELALACNHIMLVDDGSSTVALPEVPLLAVLPGTGGLTRLTDKRQVRRDLCDVFCAMEEGVRGSRAHQWRLVDEVVSNSKFDETVAARAAEFAAASGKASQTGISLPALQKDIAADGSVRYSTLEIEVDRAGGTATLVIAGPETAPPADMAAFVAEGANAYMLRLARELDDAILHLRLNEREAGLLIFRSVGDPAVLEAYSETR